LDELTPWIVERLDGWIAKKSFEEPIHGLDYKLLDIIFKKLRKINPG
jgi:hypothetical protein